MQTLAELLIAESTEYEFKSELEVKKPKSWLKTVSAFANGNGGRFFYGVDDDGTVIGLGDVKTVTEKISKLIQARISPLPDFNVSLHRTDGEKTVLLLEVQSGEIPPYYYVGDGNTTAYIRAGDESIPASPQQLSEMVRRGKNLSFDSMPTEYNKEDLAFTVFNAAYKKVAGKALSLKEYVSFGLCKPDGTLTYAGLLFADDCPLLQARVFCTHWNGLTKGSLADAIDSEEFEGDLVSLLKNSHSFVRLNSKKPWKKMSDHRIDSPDYADWAVFKILANALMHRDLDGDLDGATMQVAMQDKRIADLLEFCSIPRTRDEIQQHLGFANRDYFRKNILNPLLESGHLRMTIPDKPNSKNQQYVAVARTGLEGE
jgi:predicted HTH transcriptional regulator